MLNIRWPSLCRPENRIDVLAFDIAEAPHSITKGVEQLRNTRIEDADLCGTTTALCRHDVGRSREKQPGEEAASPHSITSSARARSVGGIVRPRAFAVFAFTSERELGRLNERHFGWASHRRMRLSDEGCGFGEASRDRGIFH